MASLTSFIQGSSKTLWYKTDAILFSILGRSFTYSSKHIAFETFNSTLSFPKFLEISEMSFCFSLERFPSIKSNTLSKDTR